MSNAKHETDDADDGPVPQPSPPPSNSVAPPDVQPRASRGPRAAAKASGTKTPRKSISPKPRKSIAPKPRASLAPKAPRKSIAPKPRKSIAPKAPRNGAKTHMFGPGENPALKFQRNEDDISIPPTSGDFDEHETFFAEGAKLASHSEPPPAARRVAGRGHTKDVAERPLVPVVPLERRQRLANLVKGAVAVSGFLCLAALVRVGLVHRAESSAHAAAAQMVSTAPAAKVTEAAPVAVDPAPAPAPANEEPTAPLKTASEEREDARKALELGKQQDAVDAAQRSLTVDPTDAEAWLILGAAQLDLGHRAEAHDAFQQCTKQAKTGNTYECGAMLSWNGPR